MKALFSNNFFIFLKENIFSVLIVILFICAALHSMVKCEIWKTLFYFFSAAINICTIFMN